MILGVVIGVLEHGHIQGDKHGRTVGGQRLNRC